MVLDLRFGQSRFVIPECLLCSYDLVVLFPNILREIGQRITHCIVWIFVDFLLNEDWISENFKELLLGFSLSFVFCPFDFILYFKINLLLTNQINSTLNYKEQIVLIRWFNNDLTITELEQL